MNLKLTLAYDGTGFRGWARQPGERTVEGSSAALETLYGSYERLVVAGRTDTGVHAFANVVSVDGRRRPAARTRSRGPERVPAGRSRRRPRARLHRRLPCAALGPLALLSLPDLAPRARSPFETNRSLWHPQPLELQRLHASAAMLVGEHDSARSHRRRPSTGLRPNGRGRPVARRGDTVELEITADSFLRHMVRTLVGTMLELEPDTIVDLLQGAPRARPARPPRHTGFISSRSGTTRLIEAVAAGRHGYDRARALSGRPLRSRRHRRRLRRRSSSPRCVTRRRPCSGGRSPTRR